MPTLLHGHPQVLSSPPAVGADDRWALFLDVDGTLLDFAHHPDEVRVDARLRDDLALLRARLSGAVALLSGRPLSELDKLFDWQGYPAAGLHGAELRMPDGHIHVTGDETAFTTLRRQAVELVDATRGILLEDKRRALALHYRHAPSARQHAARIAQQLLSASGGAFVLQHGDHVIELKPAGVDKGHALNALMADTPFRDRTPWMLGDDLTDEDAFACVNEHAGINVIVGVRRPTIARHAMANPAAVRAWLHALAGGRRHIPETGGEP